LLDADFINSLAGYKFPITRVNTDYGYTGDTSAPRPPTNLQIASEVFRNILTWDDPNSDNFWYIEVYRAKVPAGDAASTVGSAVKIASVPKTVESFVDTEVSITSYDHYYWIRAVSYGGIASLWQDGYIEGHTTINATIDSIMTTLKGADPDAWSSIVDYVVDDRVLQGGKRYKCILANLNQDPPNTTYWEQSGILITGDIGGVSTVGIDGNLVVDDTILARCINVTDAFIGMTIQSSVFTPGSAGWQINKNGDVEFNSGVFRGTVIVGPSSEVDWGYVIGTGKPDDNADVTGAHTAYDTARVNSLAATTIISGGKIGTGLVIADSIVANAVIASKINVANLAAINANMGAITAGSMAAERITAGTLSVDRIAAGSIVAGKLNVSTLSAISANLGTITAGSMAAERITAGTLSVDRIAAGAITAGKIYSEAYLGGKRLDNYAEGSVGVNGLGSYTTITHNLGRRAVCSCWDSNQAGGKVGSAAHNATSFRLYNWYTTGTATIEYCYI
jgi:hypothetical protein